MTPRIATAGLFALVLGVATALACSSTRTPARGPETVNLTSLHLETLEGNTVQVGSLLTAATWSVFVFFSAGCPTVAAHDARLIQLWRDYRKRGVSVFVVASEVQANPRVLKAERAARGYPFPLLWDKGATLARALNVRYASQAFVLGVDGDVRYAGSIDSDRRFLHADAEPFLASALDALLEGRALPTPESRAYGCALRL